MERKLIKNAVEIREIPNPARLYNKMAKRTMEIAKEIKGLKKPNRIPPLHPRQN
jgi:uncharacterized coiled-coil DUF342 family protein